MSPETNVHPHDGDGDGNAKAGNGDGQQQTMVEEDATSPVSSPESPTLAAGGVRKNLLAPFLFAYAFAAFLIYYGIEEAGIWEILSYTRVLDILIDSGLVAYTDQQMGLIKGLPSLDNYLTSQAPIHWQVLAVVGVIYTAFYLLKMVQFYAIGRFYGLKGTFGSVCRAYLYGQGLHRILPFAGGDVAVVSALVGQGEDELKAASVVYAQDRFVWFEIISFTALSVVLTGWLITALQIFWPLAFLAVLYFATRGERHARGFAAKVGPRRPFRQTLRSFASQPWLLIRLAVLSLVCFFLDDITPYLTSQALTYSDIVFLHVPFLVVQGGVVGGYLASRIPITPNGIGQYEFGFCMALMMGGTGFVISMTIIIVDGVFRHGVPLAMFAIARVWHGIETDMSQVLDRFGTEPEVAA